MNRYFYVTYRAISSVLKDGKREANISVTTKDGKHFSHRQLFETIKNKYPQLMLSFDFFLITYIYEFKNEEDFKEFKGEKVKGEEENDFIL